MSDVKGLVSDLQSLKNATSFVYGCYLRTGTNCDSSDRKKLRMEYIKEAVKCVDIQKIILNKAIILCEEDLLKEVDNLESVLQEICRSLKIGN